MASKLTVATLNVRGIRNLNKRKKIFHWISKQNVDIFCLQETFLTKELDSQLKQNWPGKQYHCYSTSSHSRGTTILIKEGLDLENITVKYKGEGRGLMINFTYNNEQFAIINIYAPNNLPERKQFFNNISEWILKTCPNHPNIIMLGDMNTHLEQIDTTTNKTNPNKNTLLSLIKRLNLVDIWRKLNKNKRQYTWVDPANKEHRTRIDYIFTAPTIMSQINKCTIKNAPVPDHKLIKCTIENIGKPRGKGYWKLNTKYLNDENYCQIINNCFDHTRQQYENVLNRRQIWDLCKYNFKTESIKYAISIKREESNAKAMLEKELETIDNAIDSNQYTHSDLEKRNKVKTLLDDMYNAEAKGAQIRSKANDIITNEINKNHFKRLENIRQKSNTINQLKCEKGKTVTSDSDILETCVNFYSKLYSTSQPREENIEQYINNTGGLPSLNQDDQNKCEGLVTNQECVDVLNKIKPGKSPGLDGLPSEFYCKFWNKIGIFLTEVFNEAYEYGELSDTQKQSVLTLIFKKGNKLDLSNYRPISLSNYDYKLLAFVLANRLHKVLNKLISSDQSGYIKGRFIGNNIRLISDTIEFCEVNAKDAVLLFLDFKKAFDSVEWVFIEKTLTKFNFGPQFKNWIKTMYTNANAKIKNNGWISSPYRLERGIRQGCPVSALLFILVVEILAQRIRNDTEVKGINIYGKNIKINQYADDTVIFLKNSSNIEAVLKHTDRFGKLAGPVLNSSKTEALSFRAQRKICAYKDIKWIKESTKCLGVYFGPDRDICLQKNWQDKVDKIRDMLSQIKCRKLSLFQRVEAIKVSIIPKLIYPATMMHTPPEILQNVNNIVWNFIWQGRDKIKRKTACRPIIEGGLGMLDINQQFQAIKAAWIPKIINSTDNWAHIAKSTLELIGPTDVILKMNFLNHKHFPRLKNIPLFYQQVLTSFNTAKYMHTWESPNDIKNEVIWGNTRFTYTDQTGIAQTLYFESWIKAGIKYLSDLTFNNGEIVTDNIKYLLEDESFFTGESMIIRASFRKYIDLLSRADDIEQQPPPCNFMSKDGEVDIQNQKCKFFYNSISQKHKINNKNEEKWCQILEKETLDFTKPYQRRLKMMCDTKVKDFNFKLFHHIIPCNYYLSNFTNKNEQCNSCGQREDIIHMLYSCQYKAHIWNIIGEHLNIEMDFQTLLGGSDNISDNLNTVINYLAYYIFLYEYLRNNNLINENNLYKYLIKKLYYVKAIYEHFSPEFAQNVELLCNRIDNN